MTRREHFGDTWVTAYSCDLAPLGGRFLADMERRREGAGRRRTLARGLAQASLRFGSTSGRHDAQERRRADGAGGRRSGRAASHLLPQGLFVDVLDRERKRAERYEHPLALILVAAPQGGAEVGQGTLWPPTLVDAISQAAGETAVVGWFDNPRVIGVIGPEAAGVALETSFRAELVRRLGVRAISRLTVSSRTWTANDEVAPPEGGTTPAGELMARPAVAARDASKRAVDIVGSFLLLVLLVPLLLLIAALLKLTSPGPILFRQQRVGQGAKPFTMLKFRTMRVDADQAVHQEYVTKFIKASAQLHPAGRAAVFKLTNDPRITPLGRILRKTSLDELPQFWNVLKGEMSLVGPRPPLPYEVSEYRAWHRRRVVDAKPGITGLWQVKGRSRTTFDEMVRLDLHYARTHTLWMDLRILLETPRAVISGKGAA